MESKCKSIGFSNGDYAIVERDIPVPGQGEVLIRVAYAAINPVDKHYLQSNRQEGSTLGSEGSGTVIGLGDGVDQSYLNKKVSFFNKAWTTHTIQLAEKVIVQDDSTDLKSLANAYINPLTACNQLDRLKQRKAKSAIALAATSQLSKQYYKLAQLEGFETILIVRKDEQITLLKEELKAKYVLNQTSPTFFEDLKEVIKEQQPTVLFEYLGGDIPSKILQLMPYGSEMICIGNLTSSPIPVQTGDILFNRKIVSGLALPYWLEELSHEERQKTLQVVATDLKEGGKIFGTQVVKVVPYTEWQEAWKVADELATQGKTLLDFTTL